MCAKQLAATRSEPPTIRFGFIWLLPDACRHLISPEHAQPLDKGVGTLERNRTMRRYQRLIGRTSQNSQRPFRHPGGRVWQVLRLWIPSTDLQMRITFSDLLTHVSSSSNTAISNARDANKPSLPSRCCSGSSEAMFV